MLEFCQLLLRFLLRSPDRYPLLLPLAGGGVAAQAQNNRPSPLGSLGNVPSHEAVSSLAIGGQVSPNFVGFCAALGQDDRHLADVRLSKVWQPEFFVAQRW